MDFIEGELREKAKDIGDDINTVAEQYHNGYHKLAIRELEDLAKYFNLMAQHIELRGEGRE